MTSYRTCVMAMVAAIVISAVLAWLLSLSLNAEGELNEEPFER